MSKKMATIVVCYGGTLTGLAFVLYQIAPALARITGIAGFVGGGLSILWGIVAFRGHKRRTWALLTSIALALVFLTQLVHAWSTTATETPGKLLGSLLIIVLMILTMGMLLYLVHGERPPEFYQKAPGPSDRSKSHQGAASSDN